MARLKGVAVLCQGGLSQVFPELMAGLHEFGEGGWFRKGGIAICTGQGEQVRVKRTEFIRDGDAAFQQGKDFVGLQGERAVEPWRALKKIGVEPVSIAGLGRL